MAAGLGMSLRVAEDHSRWPVNQIGRQSRQPSVLIFRPAQFDRDVLTVDEARFVENSDAGRRRVWRWRRTFHC